jgi:hypothetical protein
VVEFNRRIRDAANRGEIDLNPQTLDGFGDQVLKIIRIACPHRLQGTVLQFPKKQ